ncbi:Hypothetical predicted protein [Mytilus galloprovincialis]|uniref:Uncharacterized protein n=1 Tax=Mytilus galloprovincialis TaxID=29158 RepID=A0A8B6ELV1_MYTGA|nr:Hypothetical predicted protein [Mytilus galloprovincialis]
MYITVEYGDNQSLIVNPDCPTKIFTEYIHKKCNLPKDTMIDLTDENATQFDLFAKDPFESVFLLFKVRHTYLVCTVELYDDMSLKKITPILNDWEKKYPSLERKLRHRDKKAKQAEEEQVRIGSGGRRQSTIRPISSKKSGVSGKKSVNAGKKKKEKK